MAVTLDKQAIGKPYNGRVIVPYYDHWSNHPSNGLTPSKLAALLQEAERGDIHSRTPGSCSIQPYTLLSVLELICIATLFHSGVA